MAATWALGRIECKMKDVRVVADEVQGKVAVYEQVTLLAKVPIEQASPDLPIPAEEPTPDSWYA